jgi:multicomponent Na+:H+ antiporter subunit A
MLFAVVSGYIVALLLVPLGRWFKGSYAAALSLLPLVLFCYFASQAGSPPLVSRTPWVPSLGINLDFHLDGLAMLFCLLITGIGFLIFLYASYYLKGHPYLDRFMGYLSGFMASMLGLVLSDNLFCLFIFWELTSITSFFLIGFNNSEEGSRRNAKMALAVTGGGGFLLFAGFVLLSQLTGLQSIQELISQRETLQAHTLYPLLLVLVLFGACTKSAQFPFHFWLPGAMKAPTPVSAYLHSATMVKAGVYLLARFTPVLGNHPYWNTSLILIGGITMLYSAFHSLFRTDLKGILAYSTLAALGMLVFLEGLGSREALTAGVVFLLVHALYKAALFLVAGSIDHETGTRDVTRLGGLRKVMAPLALAGTIAAFSNAGIPLTFGFLSKDLIYEATLHFPRWAVVLTGAVLLTNILLLAAGFNAGIRPFAGRLPDAFGNLHLPNARMWVPPLLLGIGSLSFGMFPTLIDQTLFGPAVAAISGTEVSISLKIWHGFNLVLALSGLTLLVGFALYRLLPPSHRREQGMEGLQGVAPQQLFTLAARRWEQFALWYTRTLQNGHLRFYVFVIVAFVTGLMAYKLVTGMNIYVTKELFHELTFYEIAVLVIMLVAIGAAISTPSRLTAIASMGVIGYCLCLLFVFYSAPDLAMTQFAIDTLTVVLFVLVLFKLPPFRNYSSRLSKLKDGALAVCFGGLITVITLETLNESFKKEISQFYGENAYTLAKGKNVVNVILVDFRGSDTLVEITVLTIAAIGVFSLLKLELDKKGEPES